MNVAASLDPHVDAARRVAFVVAKTASNLGLTETNLPLEHRLQAILEEAAMRPADIEPEVYGLIYHLAKQGK